MVKPYNIGLSEKFAFLPKKINDKFIWFKKYYVVDLAITFLMDEIIFIRMKFYYLDKEQAETDMKNYENLVEERSA